jgi:uncharacterized protein
VVRRAADKKAKDDARKGIVPEGPTLRPAAETSTPEPEEIDPRHVDLTTVFDDED